MSAPHTTPDSRDAVKQWRAMHEAGGRYMVIADDTCIAEGIRNRETAMLMARAPDLLAEVERLRGQVAALASALANLHAVHRTFRGVSKSDQEWTPIDDDAMSDAEAALALVNA